MISSDTPDRNAPDRSAPDRSALFSGLPAEGSPACADLLDFLEANRIAVLAALPWAAAEIAGRDGFAVLLDVVRRLGGSRLYLSPEIQAFSRALGCQTCAATHRGLLRGAGAPAVVEIPSAWGLFLVFRRLALTQALAAGMATRAAARRFGVTERSLRRPPGPPACDGGTLPHTR